MIRILTAMAAGLALFASACVSCTLIFAPSNTVLRLEGGDWAPGIYELEVNGFNQTALCVIDLPAADAGDAFCTQNAQLELDASGERIIGLTAISFAPDSFAAQLRRDHEPIADAFYEPQYREDHPNGEQCGTRRQAQLRFDL